MNENQKHTYIAWLKDAHAMEEGLVKILERQAGEVDGWPDLKVKLEEHLEITKGHAEKVRACIEAQGAEPSGAKDVMAKMSGAMNEMGMSFMEDALVKNVHSSYAAEHFEIATYTTIIAAARELEDTDTANVCTDILADEEDMEAWLKEQLPLIVREHVRTQA